MSQLDLILNWVIKNRNAPRGTRDDMHALDRAAESAATSWKKTAGAIAAVTGALFAMNEGFEFAEEGAQIQQLESSFERMNEAVFKLPNLVNDMREAVRGTVSDVDLMRGLLTLTAGASDEMSRTFAEAAPRLLEIAKASNKLNPSLGDTAFLYESISLGIKRNSPLILDNLGIVVKVGEANEKYAASLGKTVEQLTAEEKTMALLNATMASGGQIIEQAGGNVDSMTDSYAQLRVELEKVTTELKKQAGESALPVVNFINELSQTDFTANGAARSLDEITKAADGLKRAIALGQIRGGAFGLDGLEDAGVEQIRALTFEVAKGSEGLQDFYNNLEAVFGLNYTNQLHDIFDVQFVFDSAKVEKNAAALDEIAQKSEALAQTLSNAPQGFIFDPNAPDLLAAISHQIDETAGFTNLFNEAMGDVDPSQFAEVAEVAEDNTAALEAQAAAMDALNAKTGDYYTTVASSDGALDLIAVSFEAADAHGANALQLAILEEQYKGTEEASKNLGGAIASTIADMAAADFAKTGNLDAFNEQLTRAQELADGINLDDLATEMRNQQQAALEAEESPFAEAFEPSAALAAIEEVTNAGVQGFGEVDLSVTSTMDSVLLMNDAVSQISVEPVHMLRNGFIEAGDEVDTIVSKVAAAIEQIRNLGGALDDVGGQADSIANEVRDGGL